VSVDSDYGSNVGDRAPLSEEEDNPGPSEHPIRIVVDRCHARSVWRSQRHCG